MLTRHFVMLNLFKRPYTIIESTKEKIVYILVFGLFIFLFLYLFKPFGLGTLESLTQLLVSLGFGLVTIFVLIIFKFLLEPMVINKNWNFGKSILWGLLIAISIGVANYFFVNIVFRQAFHFEYFFLAIWTAILVGIIPAGASYIISFNRMYKDALREASISPEDLFWESEVVIRGGNPKNELKLNPKNILYLCSNDNYITVVSFKDEAVTKTHLRGTLKAAEEELGENTAFFRCHKCYIINSEYVDHLIGNIQNMKIKIKSVEQEIPVSRSKASEAIRKFR